MALGSGMALLMCSVPGGAQAQTAPAEVAQAQAARYPTGLAPIAPDDYDRLPKLGKFRAWLPKRVDLSALFPVPGNQAPKPDCTAWATTYSGLGYLRGAALGHRPLATFSALWAKNSRGQRQNRNKRGRPHFRAKPSGNLLRFRTIGC